MTNLFVAHNRMHDYSYYLGFTEANYNLQQDNLGRGGAANDSETGNAQAGALTGGQPSYLGRDNANQITLQDGTPGITNQYLFQPIAGAFYSPCVDGGLDMSVVGHEYTHAISNRMIGGPDEGITSEQGGAMGESWGDLTAGEYMFSHGYSTGANPWVVGPYATGNKVAGIRDYAINKNPLNYSDYGFDSTGVEVHADGEIWNGTQWQVRQALVNKWNAKYPYADKALQLQVRAGRHGQHPAAGQPLPGQPPVDPAGLRRLPAPAGRDEHARRAGRHARRRQDALRRCGPQGDVGRVRQAGHGQGRLDAQLRLRRPDAQLRLAEVPERHGAVRGARRRQGLRRPVRGAGHPGGRHLRRRRSWATSSTSSRGGTRCSSRPRSGASSGSW